MKRRDFLRFSGLSLAATALAKASFADVSTANKPVVISTWSANTKANTAAWRVLDTNGNALDAVHQGVMVPEADVNDTSVGYGGFPDRDGKVTLDSCIMDHKGNIGSVMGLEHIVHAISVARLVMEKTPHVQLVGDGALQFAMEQGFKKENLLTEKSYKAWKNWLKQASYDPFTTIKELQKAHSRNHDTIGMLAMDTKGHLSGACTTSGMAFKMHGRVGDSPIIGAGLYVDNEVGAATATGIGEEVVRICGSHTIVEAMRYGQSPEQACKTALLRLVKLKGEEYASSKQIGFVALSKTGECGYYAMQRGFSVAIRDQNGPQIAHAKYLYEPQN